MTKLLINAILTLFMGCGSGATLVLAGIATPAKRPTFQVEPGRHLELIGVVQSWVIPAIAERIDQFSAKSSKPISLLINSPGGSVVAGSTVVDSMLLAKKRGVEFRCISGVLAASMAFIIYSHCDQRFALPNTKLLFHPMSLTVMGARVSELEPLLDAYQAMEMRNYDWQRKTLGLGSDFFRRHYYAETLWDAEGLNEAAPGFLYITVDFPPVPNLFQFNQAQDYEAQKGIPADVLKVLRRLEGIN